MPLGPLSLNVTTGVIGQPFTATVSGMQAGSTVEVVTTKSFQGFGFVNGRVMLPAIVNEITFLTLRETLAGSGYRDSRFQIIADRDGFSNAAADRWAAENGILRSIVANGANMPLGSASATGSQYMSSVMLYAPNGIRALELFFSGIRIAANAETSLSGASLMNVQVGVRPMPWKPGKGYAVGQQVTWSPTQATGFAGMSIYKAASANINSMPGPGNPDWVAGDLPAYQQATVGGQLVCGSKTVTALDGSTVTEGFWKTDPIAVLGAEEECLIDVRTWVKDGGGIAFGIGSGYSSGSVFASGTTVTDNSGGANLTSPSHLGGTALVRPSLARGIPAKSRNKKTVVIVGDSIATGTDCGYSASSATLVSGGTGYTSADIGKLVAIDNTGGTATSCSVPAIVVITNVSGGAVTGVRLWHGGSYANTGLPSGAQNTLNLTADLASVFGVIVNNTVGSGLTVTVTTVSGGFDFDPSTTAMGFIQRGLSNAGRCWTAATTPGDTLQGWATRCYSRLALLAQGNLDAAIVELGINDITGGRTLAQIKADASLLYSRLRGLGIRHIAQTTILPFPSSTDGFVTIANQTAGAQDDIRQQFNAWVRSGADGLLDGYIDVAATIENGGAVAPTGKAIVNGTIGYAFVDGKHPTPRIIPTLAAVVQDYAATHF